VDYRVSAEERAMFKRCRRQWDLGSPHRQNLRAIDHAPSDFDRAVKDALALYYFPGMWDWHSDIVLPLVGKAFMRTMAASPQSTAEVDRGIDLLEQYFAWAPSVDDFCPLKIETDVEALVPDVREPERGLVTQTGERVLYTDRVAMLALDGADECWVVVHDVVAEWRDTETLLLDEAAVAACWAWEQTFLGIDLAGTIHNEILRTAPAPAPAPAESVPTRTGTGRPGRGGYSQNEASGGGRSIPQLPRSERVNSRPASEDRVKQETAGVLRRTRIRRSRSEIETSRQQVGTEVLAMLDPALAVYPTPSAAHCPRCVFRAPCLTMTVGGDPAPELAARFAPGPTSQPFEPRLGAGGAGGRYVPIPPPT
jgi:hypothetical protein